MNNYDGFTIQAKYPDYKFLVVKKLNLSRLIRNLKGAFTCSNFLSSLL